MQNSKSPIATPTVKRRLICMVYEALLLTAVEALAMFVYLFATQNQHTPAIDHGRNAVFFLAAAAYFIHAWTGSGHTLAMKTWRLKLVKLGYARVPFRAAAIRYLMAWGWFLPAIVVCYVFGLKSWGQVGAALVAGIVAWAMTALFDKDGQFLHDRVAGTRMILLPKPIKPAK
ncbi:MAG: hypothetical protein JWR40_2918 [Massilia sp.]|nr:hypothetical protein [Massilia sp.]